MCSETQFTRDDSTARRYELAPEMSKIKKFVIAFATLFSTVVVGSGIYVLIWAAESRTNARAHTNAHTNARTHAQTHAHAHTHTHTHITSKHKFVDLPSVILDSLYC